MGGMETPSVSFQHQREFQVSTLGMRRGWGWGAAGRHPFPEHLAQLEPRPPRKEPPLPPSPHFFGAPAAAARRSNVPARTATPGDAQSSGRAAAGLRGGAGAGRGRRGGGRVGARAAARGRPGGRGGGGRGARGSPASPRGVAGRPYCGAVCGGGGASPLRRLSAPSPPLPPSHSHEPGAAAQRLGPTRREEPPALRVSAGAFPAPTPLPGSVDAELAARSCGAPSCPAAAPRGLAPRGPLS